MFVYVVYECQGGHETLVAEIFSSEASAVAYIDRQDWSSMFHYEKTEVKP